MPDNCDNKIVVEAQNPRKAEASRQHYEPPSGITENAQAGYSSLDISKETGSRERRGLARNANTSNRW